MGISEREELVLNAIVNYYLTNGETIGSRTLVKKYGIEFSSATIRNVMSDLEDMGFIEKTHTSSGRIPTDKGYKYYLEELLKVERLTKEEKRNIEMAYENRTRELDNLLEYTSNLLSKMTNYAGIALEPKPTNDRVKRIELVFIDEYLIMAIIIMEDRIVKTKKISLVNSMTKEELIELNKELNNKIKTHEITINEIQNFIMGEEVISLNKNDDDLNKIFVGNMSSLFKNKKEEEVTGVLELFNEKKEFKKLFEQLILNRKDLHRQVNVVFGDELGIKELEDASFVYSVYNIGESQGIIGVIGPKRMAYSKTVGLINHISNEVNKIIKQLENKDVKKE